MQTYQLKKSSTGRRAEHKRAANKQLKQSSTWLKIPHKERVTKYSLISKMVVGIVITACLLFATANGASDAPTYNYDEQSLWPDVCVNGNNGRQTPIDIITDKVEMDTRLMDLKFGEGWKKPVSGTYAKKGYTVQFDPTSTTSPDVLTTNHIGDYRVLQLHMHWGRNDTEGSEHVVNGKSYPLELHFVHTKVEPEIPSDGDFLAVVGVFVEVDDTMEVSGVWELLDTAGVKGNDSKIPISGFVYDDLLPTSRDYYHYKGSLTTPNCNEIVQWFVLKDTIRVPKLYLQRLRETLGPDNQTPVTFNFRELQPLRGRKVYTTGRKLYTPGTSGAPTIVASLVSMFMAMMVAMHLS